MEDVEMSDDVRANRIAALKHQLQSVIQRELQGGRIGVIKADMGYVEKAIWKDFFPEGTYYKFSQTTNRRVAVN
jgi:hypothetical protein